MGPHGQRLHFVVHGPAVALHDANHVDARGNRRERTTERTAAFIPGASPPLVKTPIFFRVVGSAIDKA